MNNLISISILTGITAVASYKPCYTQNITTDKQPVNILLIDVHDLGQHLGCYGVSTVQSPNLDNLAARGIMFKNYFSTSAVSSPSRGSMLTGRYPQSNGLMGLTHDPWWWKLNDDEKHIAQLLKAKGYSTTLIGLTHVGEPKRLGYDRHLSVENKAEETVEEVKNFFRTGKLYDKPFFLKIGFSEVHSPYRHGIDSTKGIFIPAYLKDTPEIRSEFAKFQGDIKFMDECIGKIIGVIEKSEAASNTIIIFTSDHGIGFPGAKWTSRKAGIEVPLIIYKPNSIFSGGKVYTELMSNVDLIPTLFDYAGFPIPSNIEGVSFKQFIAGETEVPPRNSVFAQYTPDMKRDNQSRTVISGKYILIRYFDAGRTVAYPMDINVSRFVAHIEREETTGSRPFFELSDIENDPYELHDLGGNEDYAAIVKELSGKLMDWMISVNDPLLKGPLSTPYYKKSMENFQKSVQ